MYYTEDEDIQFKIATDAVAQSGLRAVDCERYPLSHYASMRGSLTMDPGSEAASGHTVESLAQEIELLKREIHDRDEEIRDSVARVRYNGGIYDSRREKSSQIVREDVSLIPQERVTISQMLPMEASLKSVISSPRILPEAQAQSRRPEARQTSQLILGEAGFGIPQWVSSEATRRGSPSSHIYTCIVYEGTSGQNLD